MSKKTITKFRHKILTLGISGALLITTPGLAMASVDAYVTQGNDLTSNYSYQMLDLKTSLNDSLVNPDAAGAALWNHFVNNKKTIISLHDDIRGYIDYNDVKKALLDSLVAGTPFSVNTYTESEAAQKSTDLPEIVSGITVVNGAIATTNISTGIAATAISVGAVSGTAKVGAELIAGALTPVGATASYKWQICATSAGEYADIAGATTNKYTPVAGDVTKFVKVVVTGTGSYSGIVTSAVTGPIAKADGPALVGVTMDDAANTVYGMTSAMEISTNGIDWTAYNEVAPNLPNLTGSVALRVRVASTVTHEAGAVAIFNFNSTQVGTAPVNLGTAANYAILAKTGISSVPNSVITGNIGVSPASATYITGFSLTEDAPNGFSTSTQITGKAYASDYASTTSSDLTTAVSNMETAYTDASGRAVNYTELHSGDISGKTLTAGVYKWGTAVLINTDVTLTGGPNDVFIFQVAKGITQASGANIILSGGVQAKNIFWQAAETVKIGTTAHFEGVVLCQKNITLGTGASINGRLLAQTAVTLDQSTVVAK